MILVFVNRECKTYPKSVELPIINKMSIDKNG